MILEAIVHNRSCLLDALLSTRFATRNPVEASRLCGEFARSIAEAH